MYQLQSFWGRGLWQTGYGTAGRSSLASWTSRIAFTEQLASACISGSGRPDSGVLRMTNGAKCRIGVTTALFCLGLPSIFVVLATSGESSNGVFAAFIGRPGIYVDFWGPVELACFLGIPALVVLVPWHLHSKGRSWRDGSPVPAWLAGFASVLTAVYILTLHFDNLGLAKWHLGTLTVAAFATAVLLAPLYRITANACWKAGIAVVFDPVQWWSAWCVAYREMKGTTRDDAGLDGRVHADAPVGEPEAEASHRDHQGAS